MAFSALRDTHIGKVAPGMPRVVSKRPAHIFPACDRTDP